jgi:ABC-2 type transport system ATP-binding protein
LRFTARLGGLPPDRIEEGIRQALDWVHLTEAADRPVGTHLRGMRQRLGIAEILMRKGRSGYEPTSGLDPQTTREFLELIRSLKEEGMTVVFRGPVARSLALNDRKHAVHRRTGE